MTLFRALWLSCLIVLCLQGCTTGTSSASRNDWVTASDEPEARKRARVRMELAAGYYQQGQTTVALDEVKQAIAADARYGPAFNLRGLIYMRLNEMRLAEESFQQALRLDSRDGDAWHNLGWMHCQLSRLEDAHDAFQRALQTPGYAMAARTWMTLGICQARAGRLLDAERSLERSFELEAGNPVTLYNLALLLSQRGEDQRAAFFIRMLNRSEQANAESLWLGVKTEKRLQDHQAAAALGLRLVQRFPGSREAGAYERGAFHE